MKLIICAVLLSLAACRWEGKLKFNEQNTFTILQLTDLHFGESETKDMRTMGVQFKMIQSVKPDLVVMTGDQFSGYADQCHRLEPRQNCYESGWKLYTFALAQLKQRYAIILGNHDSQADMTREEIMIMDQKHPFSLSQSSPDGVSPGSNYYLPIYDNEEKEPATLLWMFDSHDNTCEGKKSWGCVERDQIDWFNNQYQQFLAETKREQIQGLSFIHIPPPEYVTVYNEQVVQGSQGEFPDCPCYNTGIVDALMKNDVLINISGHDHTNDYSGLYTKEGKTIELLYGRKTGYGSYGPSKGINRGGTVITIKNLGEGRINVETHHQDELGNKTFKGKFQKSTKKLRECPC